MTAATPTRSVELTVNGVKVREDVPVRMLLSDFLRHELGLTGTHVGCEHGICGACTILMNGRTARSCLMLAVQADGETLTTVEGLAPGPGALHPLQEAVSRHHGLQCGFCTAGVLTTLVELLADNPDPSEADIRIALSGNICRCTGYATIITATLDAAQRMREAASA